MKTVRLAELAAEIRKGPRPIAVLAGAGVSDSAGVPTGQQLLGLLARERGVDPGPDPVAWYLAATGDFPDYFGMVQDTPASDVLPGELYERPVPTAAHRAIARLVAAGWIGPILTTNLDRLLEQALGQAGLTVQVAFDLDAIARVSSGQPALIKLHGDYQNIGIRHTARAHTYHPVIDTLLDRVFTAFDLLVCGWSASWDVPLCDALCRATGRRVHWLQCGPASRAAQRVFAARRVSVAAVASSDAGLGALSAILLDQDR
ncbi:MAG: SIR2 family protein [Actinomadura sp.]